MVLQISIVSVSDAPSACAEVWNVFCTHLFSGITLLPALLFQFRIQDYYFSLFQFSIRDYPPSSSPFPIFHWGLSCSSTFLTSYLGFRITLTLSSHFLFPIWELGLPFTTLLVFLFSIWDFEVSFSLSQFAFQPVQCSANVLGEIFAAIWRFW